MAWSGRRIRAHLGNLRTRLLVAGMGVVMVALVAGGIALAASGRAARQSVERAHAATATSTTVTSSPTATVTTTSQPPTTATAQPATTTTTEVRQDSTTTSTTQPPIASCQDSSFQLSLTADSSSYSEGDTVVITLTVTNTGPACIVAGGQNTCAWVSSVDVTNASGSEVFSPGANGQGIVDLCPASPPYGGVNSGVVVITQTIDWSQQICAPGFAPGPPTTNPNCPQTQVPPGAYTVGSTWTGSVVTTSITIN